MERIIGKLTAGGDKAEFVSKCGNCLREIEETAYWLDLLAEANLVPQERLQAIRQECRELIAIFVTIVKRSRETCRNEHNLPQRS